MYYYAGTIRKLSGSLPTPEDLDEIVIRLKQKYTHIDVRYNLEIVEKLNGNHNVHIHYMLKSQRKVMYKMIKSILPPTYGLWHEFVKSKQAWLAYITKADQHDVRDQLYYYNEVPQQEHESSSQEETIEITTRIV